MKKTVAFGALSAMLAMLTPAGAKAAAGPAKSPYS